MAQDFEIKGSLYTQDPLTHNVVLHGDTNKRPLGYIGEKIECPWDSPKNPILQIGSAYITRNDFPALAPDSYREDSLTIQNDIYQIRRARGECLIVIYSDNHEGHWLTLTDEEKSNVFNLWKSSTNRSKDLENVVFTHIYENDGPQNTMPHPHGQQYNMAEIPPQIESELESSSNYFESTGHNLFDKMLEYEQNRQTHIVAENDSFLAYIPEGGMLPYQVRVLPKRDVLFLSELDAREQQDFITTIDIIRHKYSRLWSGSYKPTVMMNIYQAPFDRDIEYYRGSYRMRVEFFPTALNEKADKLMFSPEYALGIVIYSNTAEANAERLRNL